jgi:hypothetical protein
MLYPNQQALLVWVNQRYHVVFRHQVRQPHPQVIDFDAPALVVRFAQPILVAFRGSEELLLRSLMVFAPTRTVRQESVPENHFGL